MQLYPLPKEDGWTYFFKTHNGAATFSMPKSKEWGLKSIILHGERQELLYLQCLDQNNEGSLLFLMAHMKRG